VGYQSHAGSLGLSLEAYDHEKEGEKKVDWEILGLGIVLGILLHPYALRFFKWLKSIVSRQEKV